MISQNDKSPEISQIQTEVWREELDKLDHLTNGNDVENQEKFVVDMKKQVLQNESDALKAYKFQEANTNFLLKW